jgi:cold shock protein
MHGTVAAFDDHKGYGTIQADDGREVFFHCTRIADGSRTIAEGTPVSFELVPGHLGRDEAAAIAPT